MLNSLKFLGTGVFLLLAACGSGGGGNGVTLTNNGPVFSSSARITIEENTVGIVYTAQANDADGDTVTISVAGGPDAGVISLMSGAAKNALGLAVADGRGDKMVSEMVDFYADLFKQE